MKCCGPSRCCCGAAAAPPTSSPATAVTSSWWCCRGRGKAAAQETAERLRRAVEAYPLILGTDVIATVTLSVGVATFPADGLTVDALVEAVDQAQYIAKRSGGNKVHVSQTV